MIDKRTYNHFCTHPESPVFEYIIEEVWRQGHDVQDLDGIERVLGMSRAWWLAILKHTRKESITVADVLSFGGFIEHTKNSGGFRTGKIYIGNKPSGSEWQNIDKDLDVLLSKQTILAPMDFYRAFENIHPFWDGNGRTGKVLLNYLNNTLLKPIFPPNDFWGEPILNP